MTEYFFDTYALYELNCGNESYDRFINTTIITTQGNLYEFHYAIAREYSAPKADELYDIFCTYSISVSDEDVKAASRFRLEFKDRRVSYVDALGYVIALRRGIKFLTGDNAFRDLPNVEFVK